MGHSITAAEDIRRTLDRLAKIGGPDWWRHVFAGPRPAAD